MVKSYLKSRSTFRKRIKSIIGHGFAVIYLISHACEKSLVDGYLVGSRGSVGSSFVATMMEITQKKSITTTLCMSEV